MHTLLAPCAQITICAQAAYQYIKDHMALIQSQTIVSMMVWGQFLQQLLSTAVVKDGQFQVWHWLTDPQKCDKQTSAPNDADGDFLSLVIFGCWPQVEDSLQPLLLVMLMVVVQSVSVLPHLLLGMVAWHQDLLPSFKHIYLYIQTYSNTVHNHESVSFSQKTRAN